jgi:hypothetical protein
MQTFLQTTPIQFYRFAKGFVIFCAVNTKFDKNLLKNFIGFSAILYLISRRCQFSAVSVD